MVDAADSKSVGRKPVGVRVPLPVQEWRFENLEGPSGQSTTPATNLKVVHGKGDRSAGRHGRARLEPTGADHTTQGVVRWNRWAAWPPP